MAGDWIAALPMYDFPELEGVHDQWWSSLSELLTLAGIAQVPRHLTRGVHHEALWANARLLMGQACEYPLAKLPVPVRLVATPVYRAPGCDWGTYRGAIVVRRTDFATSLGDLRGKRCVINDWTSNSGMNLLRAALAPVAGSGPFFGTVRASGSHRRSMRAVAEGEADVASIDCVTFAQIARLDPNLERSLRILDWTPVAPSLPIITAATTDDATLHRIRSALRALTQRPIMSLLREQLSLDDFDLEPVEGYSRVLQLERAASHLGYPRLH